MDTTNLPPRLARVLTLVLSIKTFNKFRRMALALSTFTCVLGKGCLLAGGLGALSSCRTQYVAMPEMHSRDSVHVMTDRRYDSIYIDRWHTLILRGDTVFKTDSIYVEKLRDIELHDTITVTQHDTVSIAVPCPSWGKGADRRERGYIPRFYRTCTLGFFLILLCIILYVFLRIYLRR